MSMTREEATRRVVEAARGFYRATHSTAMSERLALGEALYALDAAAPDAPETGESDDFGEFKEQVEADTSLTKVGSVESGLATLGLGILVVAEEIRALAAEMRRRG